MLQDRGIPTETMLCSAVEAYALPFRSITGDSALRLDAAHYNPELSTAIKILRESGMRVARLGEVTHDIYIPPRFKRVYVDDPACGVPFLQGSHIVHFQPADIKHLSVSQHALEKWTIKAGWILVTCSGTIGRVTMAPAEWDGWAASQHILRIVPDQGQCPAGYLCSFLSSPLGQVQLTANVYGAVVDEITEEQAEGILVPLPRTQKDRELVELVDAAMRASVAKRASAASAASKTVESVQPRFAPMRESNGFSLPSAHLENAELRFDAAHFNPSLLRAYDLLDQIDTVPLGEVADVFMPARFKRVYVDKGQGIPFLQGSHVVHFQAADVKYVSRELEHVDELLVKRGWLLVTRSGTVGRITLCPAEWDGWAATEHIIRIVPRARNCPGGYLCSFLSSPLGQVQLTANVYGAVVDEIAVEQVQSVMVPLPGTTAVRELDAAMMEAIEMKSRAVESAEIAVAEITGRFAGSQSGGSVARRVEREGSAADQSAGAVRTNSPES